MDMSKDSSISETYKQLTDAEIKADQLEKMLDKFERKLESLLEDENFAEVANTLEELEKKSKNLEESIKDNN